MNFTDVSKLRSLIEDARTCMFTTADEQGSLHSRPMAIQQLDEEGRIWFFTRTQNQLGKEINLEDEVNLSVVHAGQYVSVSGRAKYVKDPAKTKELWSSLYRAWYPKGIDDPDLQLMQVDVEKAEYWESSTSVVPIVYAALKATVTGHEVEIGEHGKLSA